MPDPQPHHIAHPRLRGRGVLVRRVIAAFVGVAGLPWALSLGAVLLLGPWCAVAPGDCGHLSAGGSALVALAILSSILAAATGLGYALDPRPGLQRALLASGLLAAAPLIYALVADLL
ncbi:MAG: hypothetical protein QOH43_1779 [Solirubrobacteraceae bacterium]|nr:hypothetical protein [Solirubrobacteraceae bacterium]